MRQKMITPQFVEFIPDKLQEGVLYISEKYGIIVHKCCCGCGEEVVTPLTPADWNLRLDGTAVTMYPSIGNWNFRCKSHYWIRNNRIEWAPLMTKRQIRGIQERDRQDKEHYIAHVNARKADSADDPVTDLTTGESNAIAGLGLRQLWPWLKGCWIR